MRGEIFLEGSFQKANVTILGGDSSTLYTSIPVQNGRFLFFPPNKEVKISCTHNGFVFLFEAAFIKITSVDKKAIYSFKLSSYSVTENKRKETRYTLEIPGIITNDQELILGTIIDASQNGMQFKTSEKIKNAYDLFHVSATYNNQNIIGQGKVVRENYHDNFFYYGFQLEWNTNFLNKG